MAKSHSIAQAKYDSTHCKYYTLKMNLETDSDIIDKLASVESKQGYIKQLIRKDIASTRTETKTYHIKPEYYDYFVGSEDMRDAASIVLTETDIEYLARGWEVSEESVRKQLIPD